MCVCSFVQRGQKNVGFFEFFSFFSFCPVLNIRHTSLITMSVVSFLLLLVLLSSYIANNCYHPQWQYIQHNNYRYFEYHMNMNMSMCMNIYYYDYYLNGYGNNVSYIFYKYIHHCLLHLNDYYYLIDLNCLWCLWIVNYYV